jgi:hypothetical protein
LFATGVVYTGGKFATGVFDTGGNLPPASMTPVTNFQPVSLTPVVLMGYSGAGVKLIIKKPEAKNLVKLSL